MRDVTILYEDAFCVVSEKPQGVPSEEAGEFSMPSLLRALFASRGTPTEVYPVHRLDKPTGGAILYAKTKDGAARLSEEVSERRVGKRYLAVVSGVPNEPAGTLRDFLYHDKRQNKVFVVKGARKGAKEALLDYCVLGTVDADGETLSLLLVTLGTGRTHQIRAQFASRRLPVYGDRRSGSRVTLRGGGIALWSHELTFPAKDGTHTVRSLPPDEAPWTCFREPLTRMYTEYEGG